MRFQMRKFLDLLNDIFKLVEGAAVCSREVMEGRSIRTGSEISRFESALFTFFFGHPRSPPVAAEFFELLLRSGAVCKADDFTNGLFPNCFLERLGRFWRHVALINNRKA